MFIISVNIRVDDDLGVGQTIQANLRGSIELQQQIKAKRISKWKGQWISVWLPAAKICLSSGFSAGQEEINFLRTIWWTDMTFNMDKQLHFMQ